MASNEVSSRVVGSEQQPVKSFDTFYKIRSHATFELCTHVRSDLDILRLLAGGIHVKLESLAPKLREGELTRSIWSDSHKHAVRLL